jgi:hypothetical protein
MLTHCDELDSRAAKRTYQDFLRHAVPLCESGSIPVSSYSSLLPAVHLDCRKRPDITDLLLPVPKNVAPARVTRLSLTAAEDLDGTVYERQR